MRRSSMEVDVDILQTIASGQHKPTRIMYGANLSWVPTKTRLARLTEQGLIIETAVLKGDKRTKLNYHITKRGSDVLAQYSVLDTVLGS